MIQTNIHTDTEAHTQHANTYPVVVTSKLVPCLRGYEFRLGEELSEGIAVASTVH